MKTKYLNKDALIGLKNYKYQSGEYGVLDHVLVKWWNYALEFVPIWMAPNLVTLTGLFGLMCNYLMILSYDLTMQVKMPWYYSLFAGISLFVYQTLDAIDGKQARRTGTSSPLGQLFDHGCDAIATHFGLYMMCHLLNIPLNSVAGSLAFFGTYCAFYGCNWEEGHTHVMRCT